jgi:hypothetical protein
MNHLFVSKIGTENVAASLPATIPICQLQNQEIPVPSVEDDISLTREDVSMSLNAQGLSDRRDRHISAPLLPSATSEQGGPTEVSAGNRIPGYQGIPARERSGCRRVPPAVKYDIPCSPLSFPSSPMIKHHYLARADDRPMPIEETNVLGERVILGNKGLNPTSIDYFLL